MREKHTKPYYYKGYNIYDDCYDHSRVVPPNGEEWEVANWQEAKHDIDVILGNIDEVT